MSGGFDLGGIVDFASDAFSDFATDFATEFTGDFGLDSFTDSFGTEFLTDIGGSFVDFGGDIFGSAGEFFGDIGGSLYETVGSFAGDADWFNATSFGNILDSATAGVSEFFGDVTGSFSGITNYLPTSINSITGALPGLNNVVPGLGNVIGSATGINPNLIPGLGGGVSMPGLGSIISGTTGLNPNIIPGIGGGGISAVPGIGNILTGTVGINPNTPGIGSILSSIPGAGAISSIAGAVSGLVNPQVPRPTTIPGTGSFAGFGNTTGYGTPGILPTTGINYTGLLNSGLSFLTGSTSAVAATPNYYNNTTATDPYANAPVISITGVGVNPGNTTVSQDPTTPGGNYTEIYNPETGLFDVYNLDTNEVVSAGLNEQDAILAAQDLSIGSPTIVGDSAPQPVGYTVEYDDLTGKYQVVNAAGQTVASGLTEQEAILFAQEQSVYDEGNTPQDTQEPFLLNREPELNNAAGELGGLVQQAQQQQTIRDQRQNRAQASDWRVRLRLAPNSNYLYNDPQCGPVLWPLRSTDGVIFPYTPKIDTAYKADYEPYNLTHSNYRGYFYKGSYVDSVNITATFTAQDTSEANYLLAVIHFFRSATKMFYGQDAQRGAPPPLVYLSGLGDYQFSEHPCVISQFNYNLPSDVDYIRAQSISNGGLNLLARRDRQTIAGNPLSYALQRLATALPGLTQGAESNRFAGYTLPIENPSYVPTKMDIQLTLFPMQSRQQVSKQFSVKNFANGNLLKGGFW